MTKRVPAISEAGLVTELRVNTRGLSMVSITLMLFSAACAASPAPAAPTGVDPVEARAFSAAATPTEQGVEAGLRWEKAHALVIGIDNYPQLNNLSAAVADAKAMAKELRSRGAQVEVLLDEQATRRNILAMLTETMPSRVGPNDLFILYFAGHGETIGGPERPIGYLMPHEAGAKDVAISGISMADVDNHFNRLKARHAMLVADACYSGLVLPRARGASPKADVPGYLRAAVERPSRVVMVAGTEGQQALEQGGHGYFTRFFLEGIRGAADDNADGVVTTHELYSHVRSNVSIEASVSAKREQVPQMAQSGSGELVFLSAASKTKSRAVSAAEPAAVDEDKLDPELYCDTRESCMWIAERMFAAGKRRRALDFYRAWSRQDRLALMRTGELLASLRRYDEANAEFQAGCDEGIAEACVRLGVAYESGLGASRDLVKASQLYRAACDLGQKSWGCLDLDEVCARDPSLPLCTPCAGGGKYELGKGCTCEDGASYVEGAGCKCFDGARYEDGRCACLSGARYEAGRGCQCEDGVAYVSGSGCDCPKGKRACGGTCQTEPCRRVKPPNVRIGKAKVVKSLSRSEILREIGHHRRFFAGCMRPGRHEFKLQFDIEGATGRVRRIQTPSLSGKSPDEVATIRCVAKRVARISFPARPGSGLINIGYPFILDSGSPD